MIDEKFAEIMRGNTGCAVVMAGSGSDEAHIEKIVGSLKKYEVPHQVRIASAHKQADGLMSLIGDYNGVGGSAAYVAVAGGTDALSGTLSYHINGPVISCPPDGRNESCLSNPPGSSNAYIERPANVGRFVAQIYRGFNTRFAELIDAENREKIASLVSADNGLSDKYLWLGPE